MFGGSYWSLRFFAPRYWGTAAIAITGSRGGPVRILRRQPLLALQRPAAPVALQRPVPLLLLQRS